MNTKFDTCNSTKLSGAVVVCSCCNVEYAKAINLVQWLPGLLAHGPCCSTHMKQLRDLGPVPRGRPIGPESSYGLPRGCCISPVPNFPEEGLPKHHRSTGQQQQGKKRQEIHGRQNGSAKWLWLVDFCEPTLICTLLYLCLMTNIKSNNYEQFSTVEKNIFPWSWYHPENVCDWGDSYFDEYLNFQFCMFPSCSHCFPGFRTIFLLFVLDLSFPCW